MTANKTLTAIADHPLVVKFVDAMIAWANFTIIAIAASFYLPWWLSLIGMVVVISVAKENAHRVFKVGLFVVAFHLIPHQILFPLCAFLVLIAPDEWYFEGYRETYRAIEIHLSKVAIAQAQAQFDQLGMEMTAIAIADHFDDMLRLDQKPLYYRRFRRNLKHLCKTILKQRYTIPKDRMLGYDYATMETITESAVKSGIESDRQDRRKRRLALEQAASVEYAA